MLDILPEALAYIKDESNWPDGAVRAVFQSNGVVGFFGTKQRKWHYGFEVAHGTYYIKQFNRVELFPAQPVPVVGLDVASGSDESHITVGPRCPDPMKYSSITVKYPGSVSAIVHRNGTRRYIGINSEKGEWGSSDNIAGPFLPDTEPTLTTLITNGQWFPVYDTPGFESGLKRRGVPPERMVQIIMVGGMPRISAVEMHNFHVAQNGGHFMNRGQRYEWVVNERDKIEKAMEITVDMINNVTNHELDKAATMVGLERAINQGVGGWFESDDALRVRILEKL